MFFNDCNYSLGHHFVLFFAGMKPFTEIVLVYVILFRFKFIIQKVRHKK